MNTTQQIQRNKQLIVDLRARTAKLKAKATASDLSVIASVERTLNQCSAVLNRYAS